MPAGDLPAGILRNDIMDAFALTLNRKNEILLNKKPTGFRLERGKWTATYNDRFGRWYIVNINDESPERTGYGFETKAKALAAYARLNGLTA